MPTIIVLLRLRMTFALCRQRVNNYRSILDLLCLVERGNQSTRIMAIHIADILEAQLADECSRQDGGRKRVLHRLGGMMQTLAYRWDCQQLLFNFIFETVITVGTSYAIQITG